MTHWNQLTPQQKENKMTNLPPHLQKLIEAHEAKLEKFGLKPMYKILEEQKENMEKNPDHILHAFIAG